MRLSGPGLPLTDFGGAQFMSRRYLYRAWKAWLKGERQGVPKRNYRAGKGYTAQPHRRRRQ